MKNSRREFLASSAVLAAWLGMGGRAFGAPRPKFGFDVTKCKVKAKFDKTVAEYGPKLILFTEIGQRSARGCVSSPWDAWTETVRDEREQADYMEAVFETFADKPQWAGMFWWKWDETQKRDHFDPDPKKDRGFRIYGKAACDVFRKWSGRL